MTTLSHRSTLSRLATLTTAHLIMGAILLAAALLRFVQLDALPLSPAESGEALAAYSVWEPLHRASTAIGSPLYFALTALLKPLSHNADGTMRLVPALFGLALVALPWLLRRQLGTAGALVAAALLAVAPSHVTLARTAGGDSAALFAGLLLAVAWIRLTRPEAAENERRWLIVAAVALALGLAGSALFYSVLVALLAAGLLARLPLPRPERATLQMAGGVAGISLLLLSTLALTQPAGLGAAATLLADWLGGFGFGATLATLPLALLRYEAGALLLGLPALVLAFVSWSDDEPALRLLPLWALTGLLLALLQNGALNHLALVVLPLYLLAGWGVGRLLAQPADGYTVLVLLLGIAWGGIALVNIGRYTRLPASNFFPLLVVVLILLAFAFLIVTVVPQTRSVLQGLALSAVLVWAFVAWGTATSLTQLTGNDPRELWVQSAATDSDVRLLRNTLRQSSFQLDSSVAGLAIVSTVDTPTLRWYLRDFSTVTFADTLAAGSSPAAALVPLSAEPPALSGDYVSTQFDLLGRRDPDAASPTLTQQLQWWFFRDSRQPVSTEVIQLWLRVNP